MAAFQRIEKYLSWGATCNSTLDFGSPCCPICSGSPVPLPAPWAATAPGTTAARPDVSAVAGVRSAGAATLTDAAIILPSWRTAAARLQCRPTLRPSASTLAATRSRRSWPLTTALRHRTRGIRSATGHFAPFNPLTPIRFLSCGGRGAENGGGRGVRAVSGVGGSAAGP